MVRRSVLITGGAGFLAQHVIRELQLEEFLSAVSEIIVVDKKDFKPILSWPSKIPIVSYEADVSDVDGLDRIFSKHSITHVIHLASSPLPFRLLSMLQDYEKNIVQVTRAVIDVMQRHSVPWLIHCSDAHAVCDEVDCQSPTEVCVRNAGRPAWFLFGRYAAAKLDAETLAMAANDTQLADGNKLHVSVVRPSLLYGEGDTQLVPYALSLCKRYGHLPLIGYDMSVTSFTYAGNAAMHIVKLAQALEKDPEAYGREEFFVTENTYPEKPYKFIRPFVEAAGYKVSEKPAVKMELLLLLLLMVQLFINLAIRYFGLAKVSRFFQESKLAAKMASWTREWPHPGTLRVTSHWWVHFKSIKSRNFLDYIPKYEQRAAVHDSVLWWKNNASDI